MKKILIFLFFLLIGSIAYSQERAYIIYNSKGKKVSYKKMMKTLVKKDILFLGEIHNNAISHFLQYEITIDLHEKRSIILGAEMFETDTQEHLDAYLQSRISYEEFDSLGRLWPNYKTDYAPIVDFAIEHKLPFIASNIPRRYASLVYRKGFESLESLTEQEKAWIAPLPIPYDSELSKYKEILEMMGDHGTPELVKAQAIKDATMAHFILKNHQQDHVFIHLNGAYHSDDYEGIMWYVVRERAGLDCGSVSTVVQADINKLESEYLGKADFIICVDENMTNTY